MLIVARKNDYSQLKNELEGKKVVIWTCNTCIRLCNGIGGSESAERLARKLREDGIDVTGVYSTSASCLEAKVAAKKDEVANNRADVVLSLTCDMGALCASRVFLIDVINPIETFGYGFLSLEGKPVWVSDGIEKRPETISDRMNPFV